MRHRLPAYLLATYFSSPPAEAPLLAAQRHAFAGGARSCLRCAARVPQPHLPTPAPPPAMAAAAGRQLPPELEQLGELFRNMPRESVAFVRVL